ncbi:MAG TPA: cyclase [Acholeplasmataceae bacterium]|nr:MAG: cyclase [Tenericutes bacterium GWC2_39_45]OHE32497.1 MAG: cyclase [Tenericutes bacterium GWD2_38_27]HBY65232.1 cyclase [Acholeplasmataceae bacterium]
MRIYDVSMTIHKDVMVWKDKPEKKPILEVVSDFEYAPAYETKLTMNLHTGTHMDFPLHMIKDGQNSDQLDLNKLITVVKVYDLSHLSDSIQEDDIKDFNIKTNDFVLFKTRNSFEDTFNNKFVYLGESAASFLANQHIKGVGVDGLGVERDQEGHPTHKLLFNSNAIIIEGLRLKDIQQGIYMMYALPIKIKGVEALPLSIILIEE